jgi:hypothetical protein
MRGADTGSVAGRDGMPTIPPLLDPSLLSPASLLAMLRFEPVGSGERLGCEVLVARAWPRGAAAGTAEVSFEFEFDAEHGTVLRRARFEDGRCVQMPEALSACFDGPIDPDRFEFDAPFGGQGGVVP